VTQLHIVVKGTIVGIVRISKVNVGIKLGPSSFIRGRNMCRKQGIGEDGSKVVKDSSVLPLVA
jgi:hypothetical protein